MSLNVREDHAPLVAIEVITFNVINIVWNCAPARCLYALLYIFLLCFLLLLLCFVILKAVLLLIINRFQHWQWSEKHACHLFIVPFLFAVLFCRNLTVIRVFLADAGNS